MNMYNVEFLSIYDQNIFQRLPIQMYLGTDFYKLNSYNLK